MVKKTTKKKAKTSKIKKPVKKIKATTAPLKKEPRVNRQARSKARKHKEKSFKMGLFLGKFFVIFAILTIIIELLDLSVFTSWLASICATPFGLEAQGNAIMINGQQFAVTNACTGLMSASILAAVIFALKKPEIEKKIVIFLAGLVVLLVANIPRIMLVLWTATVGLDAGLVHTLTWFLMSALILLLWYYGTKLYAKIDDFSELL